MFKLLKSKKNDFENWSEQYFIKEKQVSFFLFGFSFINYDNYNKFIEYYKLKDDKLKNHINKNFKYNKDIIQFDYKYKLNNYKLSNYLLWFLNNNVSFTIEKHYDLTEIILKIKIFKYNDLLVELEVYDNDFESIQLDKIKRGELIMSNEKENYIISELSKELDLYDLSLVNYDYFIKDLGLNNYEIELEHLKSGKIILINNVKLNEKNKIINIGKNNGFVL